MADRKITEKDREKAAKLKQLYENKKKELGLTQVKAAETLEMTQGAISQYFNALVPLNTDAILKFSELLQEKPERIDPELKLEKYIENSNFISSVPVMGTLTNRQPSKYLISLWLKKNIKEKIAIEADAEYEDIEKGQYIILDMKTRPRKNNKVIIKLRKRNRFDIGKVIESSNEKTTVDISGISSSYTPNEISYIAKISEIASP